MLGADKEARFPFLLDTPFAVAFGDGFLGQKMFWKKLAVKKKMELTTSMVSISCY